MPAHAACGSANTRLDTARHRLTDCRLAQLLTHEALIAGVSRFAIAIESRVGRVENIVIDVNGVEYVERE